MKIKLEMMIKVGKKGREVFECVFSKFYICICYRYINLGFGGRKLFINFDMYLRDLISN